ncbi:MAG: glycosyltransferase family 1 protein [Luteolibacter sp.]|uniref:glycosyltransferase family 4 protein n=1 Tax=Luteolibacter sp. TaxID=1962973 RepID=UPI003265E70B
MSSESPTKPLWIEVVTDTYVPDINGVSFSLGRLCNGLRGLGHRVEIIRSGSSNGENETTVLSWPLPGYWEIKVGAPWPGELYRRWKKNRPDVIYVAIETPLGFSAAAAALKLGIPVVGGFHTNFREYLQNYGVHWVGKQVWRYQKWFHDRLDRTLVPSPDAREKLIQAGFSKVSVLGRGVDTELFSPARRSEALRREYGVTGETPIALVVGRVSTEKNIGLAIRAFAKMKQACPEMVCMVIGDGPARSKLMRDHPDVLFPGYLTGESLAACCASCDIMLFPSETETFGNVLIEGMSSGLAVLGYDYAAAGWHGSHGENLLKVGKGDEAAFLDAAVDLLEPSLRAKLGGGARRTAETLGWPAIIIELENVFREVINR